MERLKERLSTARQALRSFDEILSLTKTPVVRDAAIQRFEYTFEAVWKCIQLYLKEIEGIKAGSPKGVVRSSLGAGLLDEGAARIALEMIDDRNLTVHTYNEALAEQIYSRLHTYGKLMGEWMTAAENRLA